MNKPTLKTKNETSTKLKTINEELLEELKSNKKKLAFKAFLAKLGFKGKMTTSLFYIRGKEVPLVNIDPETINKDWLKDNPEPKVEEGDIPNEIRTTIEELAKKHKLNYKVNIGTMDSLSPDFINELPKEITEKDHKNDSRGYTGHYRVTFSKKDLN